MTATPDPIAGLDFAAPAEDRYAVTPQRLWQLIGELLLRRARTLAYPAPDRPPGRIVLDGLEHGMYNVRVGDIVIGRLDPDTLDATGRPDAWPPEPDNPE